MSQSPGSQQLTASVLETARALNIAVYAEDVPDAETRRILSDLGISILRIPGVEADDVIGTLALQGLAQDLKVTISTGDKDFAQLVRPGIELVNTMTGSRMDSDAAVMDKFGVRADQIIDLLALMGDTVDNVPGVEKCGPKTAAKWLAESARTCAPRWSGCR
ncbi:hypothetical protein G6F40_014940 [Rhizopus arrhizus]|nr:hypothetical protein G6F40_014940 [Rhizopus arrhizus]